MKLPYLIAPLALCGLAALAVFGASKNPAPHRGAAERRARRAGNLIRIRSHAQWLGSPGSLKELCQKSDTIIVGQVGRIVREAYSVPGVVSSGTNTTYEVGVERYLEWDGAPQQPPTLNIVQNGGIDAEQGTVLVVSGDPMLNVGDRYILFLTVAKRDIVSVDEGVSGVSRFRGEARAADRIRGKLRLVDGKTTVPNDPYQTVEPWAFEYGGGCLLGITEGEAIARIRAAVGTAPKQVPGGGYPGGDPF